MNWQAREAGVYVQAEVGGLKTKLLVGTDVTISIISAKVFEALCHKDDQHDLDEIMKTFCQSMVFH